MTGHAPDFGEFSYVPCWLRQATRQVKGESRWGGIHWTVKGETRGRAFEHRAISLAIKIDLFSLFSSLPRFLGMLMVGANAGIVGMTKEHLGLALALSVPVFVVVTKIDMCPPKILQENLRLLIRILKSPGCRKVPVTVKTPDDVVVSATNFVSER